MLEAVTEGGCEGRSGAEIFGAVWRLAGLGSRHDCADPAEEAGGMPHLLEAWLCCPEPPARCEGHPTTAATTLAFFAMVGFEDSVNMVEETKDPSRIFPRILLVGLLLTGLVYVLGSISAITLVPPDELGEGETPPLKVVKAGAPSFPLEMFGFITMFVVNSALINMRFRCAQLNGAGLWRPAQSTVVD